VAERRTADAEQTDDTSGQTPLPLWVTIGDEDLADATPDPEDGAFIGEYPTDRALQDAVDGHSSREYILAVIAEVRGGAILSTTETASSHEREATTDSTSGQTELPLWVTIGDEDLADENPDPEEGAFIGEYSSDDALQGAVAKHDLADYILAAIVDVRRGAEPPTTAPPESGAEDAS
jgi:hypothetical protein